jgi:ribosomal protein L7/L12
LAELFGVLFPSLVALYLIVNAQLDSYRKRIRFLEVKVDALIKHNGIEFDDNTLVPVEVHKAVKAGQRLKAIRLYRKITGAGLKEASEVIDGLVKNT